MHTECLCVVERRDHLVTDTCSSQPDIVGEELAHEIDPHIYPKRLSRITSSVILH